MEPATGKTGTGKETAAERRSAINAAVRVAAHLLAEHEGTEYFKVLIIKTGPKVRYEVTTGFIAE